MNINEFDISIPSEELKQFAQSLNLLSKFGKEILFDIENRSLTLRSLNDAKSAFLSIVIANSYYTRCVFTDSLFCCSVASKSLYSIFKSLKNVASASISACKEGSEHFISVELVSPTGIRRIHRLLYSISDSLMAKFDLENSNLIRYQPHMLCQLFEHIYCSPEISMNISSERLSLQSFNANFDNPSTLDTSRLQSQHLTSNISISMDEFESYEFQDGNLDLQLLLPFREIKSYLNFCELQGLNSSDLRFLEPGKPIFCSAKGNNFDIEMVLATLQTITEESESQNNDNYEETAENEYLEQPNTLTAILGTSLEQASANCLAVSSQEMSQPIDKSSVVIAPNSIKRKLFDAFLSAEDDENDG